VDESAQSPESVTDLSHSAEDAPIIRMANSILALAIKKSASDIHVEPQEKDLTVRFRIDGDLQVVQVLPKKVQMGLISRFKIISKLDIAEKRLPQDGRISVRLEERPSIFASPPFLRSGAKRSACAFSINPIRCLDSINLILHPQVLALVREMIAQPYGIIYVTGPTGSGKTTSLYSALAELNDPDVNISTAKIPSSMTWRGSNQVQAHRKSAWILPVSCAPFCARTRTLFWWARRATKRPPTLPWRRR